MKKSREDELENLNTLNTELRTLHLSNHVQAGLWLHIKPYNFGLLKVLTPESFTSTASSFPRLQQSQQLLNSVGYRTIGFGQRGLVFERSGRGYVPKVAKPSYEESLWADFKAHYSISQVFLKHQSPD
ncbi:hypothetical protein N7490_000693 [Penicillium lividum]|nr:hypothetical protein N7490_000693 [Penicillium lividum]